MKQEWTFTLFYALCSFCGSYPFICALFVRCRVHPCAGTVQKTKCWVLTWAGCAGLLLSTAFPLVLHTCSSLALMNPENKTFCTSESYYSPLAWTSLWIKFYYLFFCKSLYFSVSGTGSLTALGHSAPMGWDPINSFLMSKYGASLRTSFPSLYTVNVFFASPFLRDV